MRAYIHTQGARAGAICPFTITAVGEVNCGTFSVEVFENLFENVFYGQEAGSTYVLCYCDGRYSVHLYVIIVAVAVLLKLGLFLLCTILSM